MVATGFDAAAARYDADEGDNPILRHMRARAEARFVRAFAPGMRVLELGSGTGTEAARNAARGVRMVLADPSPHLLEVASAKVKAAHTEGLIGAHALPGREIGTLVDTYGRASFGGAYSSFGALNCEPALEPVAQGLRALLEPGARVVLSIINRWCPPEAAWYLAHAEWRNAVRRLGGPIWASAWPGGPKDVLTTYYDLRDLRRAFASGFALEHVEALPLLWPPPYLDFLVRRAPRAFAALERLEPHLATWPVLRNLGDHVLVELRRTASP